MKRLATLPLLVAGPLAFAEPAAFDGLSFHATPKPLPAGAVTEDWPRFLGPRHDLHSKETKLLKTFPATGPKVVWESKRGTGHAPPVISGDRLVMIHALEDREVIECLHPETGRRHWNFDYPVTLGSNYGTRDAPRSGPVIDGDLVFTVGVRGDLHCLDLARNPTRGGTSRARQPAARRWRIPVPRCPGKPAVARPRPQGGKDHLPGPAVPCSRDLGGAHRLPRTPLREPKRHGGAADLLRFAQLGRVDMDHHHVP